MALEHKFLKVLDVLNEIATDKRISLDVREEYMDKISDILEAKEDSI